MKAERRHELKTNTLAQALTNLPTSGRRYLGPLLVAVIVALLIVVLVRYRLAASQRAALDASESLAEARQAINELRGAPWWRTDNQEQIASNRRQLVDSASGAIDRALKESKDRKVKAEALVARGDLNWQLANFPALPIATTRPSLGPAQPASELLQAAKDAYDDVATNYSDVAPASITAHFGLAAIAENAGDWETAKKYYSAIKDMPDASTPLKDQAERRLELLTKLREPVYIAPASTASTTLPAMISAATTQPATTRAGNE